MKPLRNDFLLHRYWKFIYIAFIAMIYILFPQVKYLIKNLDGKYFGYYLVDLYNSLNTQENWTEATPLPTTLSYDWAKPDRSGTIRIAHALGAWQDDKRRNTIGALKESLTAGFNLVEVDLIPDKQMSLECSHDLADYSYNKIYIQYRERCDFDQLIGLMRDHSFSLVVDLKSNFEKSATALAARTPPELASRIIFQLYEPQDIATYLDLRKQKPFAGPLLTLYRSHRSVFHMRPNIERLNIRVLTVPIERIKEFKSLKSSKLTLLTHPLSSCTEVARILREGFEGGYMDSTLSDRSPRVSDCRPLIAPMTAE